MKINKSKILSIIFLTILFVLAVTFATKSNKASLTLLFIVGAIIHLIMILGREFFSRGMIFCLAISLIGLAPGKREREYDLYEHVFLALILFIVFVAINFRKNILQLVDEKRIVQIFVIALYIGIQIFITNVGFYDFVLKGSILFSAVIISPLIVFIIFSKKDISNTFKFMLYVWSIFFAFIIVVMQVDIRIFSTLFTSTEYAQFSKQEYTNALMSGIVLVPLIANGFYLLDLIPIPGKRQSFKSRMKELRVTIKEYLERYDSTQSSTTTLLSIMFIQVLVLVINFQFNILSQDIVILASILISDMFVEFKTRKSSVL